MRCADFLVTRMRDEDGRLLRTYNRGQARLRAVLEDHAFLLEALIALYQATFDPRWFAEARALADTIIERFSDAENGGFFSTADDHEQLITRRKDIEDNPIPAGQSAAALGLLRLAALTGEYRYEEAALGAIRLLHALAPQHPAGVRPPAAGDRLPRLPRARGRARRARPRRARARGALDSFRPHVVLAGGEADGVPLLEGREPVDGRAAAYVCERFMCQRPVTEPDELDGAARAEIQAEPRFRTLGEMARILTIPAGRRAKFVVAAVFFLVTAIVGGLFSGKFEDAQENETVSFLPGKAESVKSLEAVKRYPGGELAPAVDRLRAQGRADRRRPQPRGRRTSSRSRSDRPSIALPPQKPVFSRERRRRAVLAPDPRDRGLRPLRDGRWTRSAAASAASTAG